MRLIKGVLSRGVNLGKGVGAKYLLYEENGEKKCLVSVGDMNSSYEMSNASISVADHDPEGFLENMIYSLKKLPFMEVIIIYFSLFDTLEDQKRMACVTGFAKFPKGERIAK